MHSGTPWIKRKKASYKSNDNYPLTKGFREE